MSLPDIELAPLKPVNVVIYEYGARLDRECEAQVNDQLFKAHCLYNEIVAAMRATVAAVTDTVLAAAGPEATELHARIDALSAAFDAAKAKNDREAMKTLAQQRRDVRRELWPKLADARKRVADQTRPIYARIGRNASCESYQLRSAAVAAGLGWATANQVLEAALSAWKKSIKLGHAPRFAKAAEKTQRTLTLQFTSAGGVRTQDLLAGRHKEFVLQAPKHAAPRQYGAFQFRLGAAAAQTWATGTWQYHRPLPDDSSIGLVRLVARRKANKTAYALQFMVKLPMPVHDEPPANRKPLVALHLGWSADVCGRRLAGQAPGADPGLAEVLRLPPDIESDLARADAVQSARDEGRNAMVAEVKAADSALYPEAVREVLQQLRRLPPEYIPPRRLYTLARLLREHGLEEDPLHIALCQWRQQDRKVWQAREGVARRARNRRKDHYRHLAKALVSTYACIAIEPLDLLGAAIKLDEETGEKTEFTKTARSGRFIAALYELEQAIAWACTRTQTPLVLASAPTVERCAYCGGHTTATDTDWHVLQCASCGASVDRKLAGAANAWQLVEPHLAALATQFQDQQHLAWTDAQADREMKLQKMAEGRSNARRARGPQAAAG